MVEDGGIKVTTTAFQTDFVICQSDCYFFLLHLLHSKKESILLQFYLLKNEIISLDITKYNIIYMYITKQQF